MLQRATDPIDTPYTVKLNDDKFETYFPGFYYTTDSGIYIDKVTCQLMDEIDNIDVPLVDIDMPENQVKNGLNLSF
jgi:hypothetical protein